MMGDIQAADITTIFSQDKQAAKGDSSGEQQQVSADDSSGEQQKTTADDSAGEQQKATADDSAGEQQKVSADDSAGEQQQVSADDSSGEQQQVSADDSAGEQQQVSADDSSGKQQQVSAGDSAGEQQQATAGDSAGFDTQNDANKITLDTSTDDGTKFNFETEAKINNAYTDSMKSYVKYVPDNKSSLENGVEESEIFKVSDMIELETKRTKSFGVEGKIRKNEDIKATVTDENEASIKIGTEESFDKYFINNKQSSSLSFDPIKGSYENDLTVGHTSKTGIMESTQKGTAGLGVDSEKAWIKAEGELTNKIGSDELFIKNTTKSSSETGTKGYQKSGFSSEADVKLGPIEVGAEIKEDNSSINKTDENGISGTQDKQTKEKSVKGGIELADGITLRDTMSYQEETKTFDNALYTQEDTTSGFRNKLRIEVDSEKQPMAVSVIAGIFNTLASVTENLFYDTIESESTSYTNKLLPVISCSNLPMVIENENLPMVIENENLLEMDGIPFYEEQEAEELSLMVVEIDPTQQTEEIAYEGTQSEEVTEEYDYYYGYGY